MFVTQVHHCDNIHINNNFALIYKKCVKLCNLFNKLEEVKSIFLNSHIINQYIKATKKIYNKIFVAFTMKSLDSTKIPPLYS